MHAVQAKWRACRFSSEETNDCRINRDNLYIVSIGGEVETLTLVNNVETCRFNGWNYSDNMAKHGGCLWLYTYAERTDMISRNDALGMYLRKDGEFMIFIKKRLNPIYKLGALRLKTL